MDNNQDRPKNIICSTNSTIMTSQNNLSIIGSNKLKIKQTSSKKENNVISFMKEKNKFYLNNLFDEKGSNQFLAAKEKALMEIELNEQIPIITKNNKKDKSHKSKHVKYCSEIKIYEENKQLKEKYKDIAEKTSSHSKKKSAKKIKKSKTGHKKSIIKLFKIDDNSEIIDTQENNEDLNKKLNKKIGGNNKEIFKSYTAKIKTKKNRSPTNKRHKKKDNPFNFSEIAKNLMSNEDIEVSSINDDTLTHHKIQTIFSEAASDSNQIENKKEKINDNKDLKINSEKEVYLNILFEL